MRPQTVLLVEDDNELRRLFRAALSFERFNVREAPGGLEALRLLDADPPDIVVLDLMMPGVDGFAVRRELEASAHTRSIPILVVTSVPADDVQHLNVQCILTKPVLPAELVSAVRRCLGNARAAGALN